MLVSAVQQHESVIILLIYIPSLLSLSLLPPIPPLEVIIEGQTGLPVLLSKFPLTILHIIVYLCQCYFLSLSHHLLSTQCPKVHSLGLHLHSFSTNMFISYTFLDFICMYVSKYNIQFCLSVLFHSL